MICERDYLQEGASVQQDLFAGKKEIDYMFSNTLEFKSLGVRKYIGPGLNYDVWSKSMGFTLQKLRVPYGWLDSDKMLSHLGLHGYDN